jgi:hypothetical protein
MVYGKIFVNCLKGEHRYLIKSKLKYLQARSLKKSLENLIKLLGVFAKLGR